MRFLKSLFIAFIVLIVFIVIGIIVSAGINFLICKLGVSLISIVFGITVFGVITFLVYIYLE